MIDRANADLAQPFRGVTGNGVAVGLFPLTKTGIALASVVEAARSFLAMLTAEQRKAACFAIGDEAWRKWSNIHPCSPMRRSDLTLCLITDEVSPSLDEGLAFARAEGIGAVDLRVIDGRNVLRYHATSWRARRNVCGPLGSPCRAFAHHS
jgi:hypothetical protein